MRHSADQARRFRYAVAVSGPLHAIALFGPGPALRETLQEPVAPPPLVTRIIELAKPSEPAPPPPEKKPPPRPDARKPEPRASPQPTPAPSVAEPLPVPAPSPAPAPAEPPPVAS